MGKKILSVVFHAFICLFFLVPPFWFSHEENPETAFTLLKTRYYWLSALSFTFRFYVNYYYLIPKFYLRKKHGKYALSLFALFVIFYILKPFFLMFSTYMKIRGGVKLNPSTPLKVDTLTVILFIIVVSLGMAIQMI